MILSTTMCDVYLPVDRYRFLENGYFELFRFLTTKRSWKTGSWLSWAGMQISVASDKQDGAACFLRT